MATFAQPQKAAHALDPVKTLPAAEAVPHAPAAAPVVPAVAPVTAAQPAAQADPAAVFPHLTDAAAAPATTAAPRKVKTETITPDSTALLRDLGQASGLSKAELSTARTTAGNLLTESAAAGVINPNQYAYELATARRESHLGNWPNEFGGNAYFEKKYGPKSSHRDDLQNTHPGDGARFHGRGLVQITGRRNYTDWTQRLANENYLHNGQPVDLVNNPALAADPQIAAHIAVVGSRDGTFTQHKLGDYVNANQTDYYHARRVINGLDHAQEIADQATSFQHVLERHRGDYADAVLQTQLKNLPSAHEGGFSGTASVPTDQLFAPATASAGKFVTPDKLLSNSVGHFDGSVPLGKYTTLAAHPVTPAPAAATDQTPKTEPAS